VCVDGGLSNLFLTRITQTTEKSVDEGIEFVLEKQMDLIRKKKRKTLRYQLLQAGSYM
jgi:hypothetical protein